MRKKIFTYVVCLGFLTVILTSLVFSLSNKDLIPKINKSDSSNAENDIYKYEKTRNKLLDENLNLYDIDKDRKNILRNTTLNVETGLVGHIDKTFHNLSAIDKLKKQIELLTYLNKNNIIIDSAPLFIEYSFKEMQLSSFLKSKNLDGDLTKKENIVELAINIDEIFENTDFKNKDELVDYVNMIINTNLSAKEKSTIIEKYNISQYIKINI